MTDETTTSGTSIGDVFRALLTGLESSIFSLVASVIATFVPQFVSVTGTDLLTIGNNFRLFLSAIGNGTPWGQTLADMMTADWNATEGAAKQIGIDFAEAVATVLETAGLLPQGK